MTHEPVDITEYISVRVRTYFSKQHIQSAQLFARLAAEIEQSYDGQAFQKLYVEHRAYVTGSIFAAVSFLEATINELFSDTLDDQTNGIKLVKEMDPDTSTLLANMWQFSEQFNTLDKFQIVLLLARKTHFDKGMRLYQDVKDLIGLRNALIHYKPEWVWAEPGRLTPEQNPPAHKMEKKLKAKKFQHNPLAAKKAPYFPDKCLSYGCAKWAVASSFRFADEFFKRMELSSRLDDIRSEIIVKP
ncbi:MAG: hypothetical protein HYZ49_01655 [Chloroflexi bacterium]|nr:hypothetical protein [Chloroflexota bacterium]